MDSNPTRPSIVLRGYAGWLEFFGFCQLYVGPVFTALAVIVSLFLQQILQQKFGGELIYSIVQLVGLIIFTVCGSLVGEMLRDIRTGAVKSAMTLIVAGIVCGTLLNLAGAFIYGDRQYLVNLLVGCIVGSSWITYFRVSKRVKATYSHKFTLGKVLATPEARKALAAAGNTPDEFTDRHVSGDWGELAKEEKEENEKALQGGSLLLSEYRFKNRTKIRVVTERDRSSTCIMLPEEY